MLARREGLYEKIQIVLTVVGIVALVLVAVVLFLLLAGFRFTSKSACDEYWRDEPVIETDDFDFYLNSLADEDGNDIRIDLEIAIKKYGFLYKRVEGEIRLLTTADGEKVGDLITYVGDGRYYHFIHYNATDTEWVPEGDKSLTFVERKYQTDRITLNGKEIELVQMSHFTTEAPVTEFEINGVTVLVGEQI